jgi:glycosyltransferase involved in cell wall biosynthesis
MTKICHIISGDLWAGAEVMCCNLLKMLKQYPDIRVSVIMLNEGRLAHELHDAGLSVLILDESRHSFARLTRMVRKFCAEEAQDIIHTHRYKENIIAFIAAGATRSTRLVATQHGLPEISEDGAKTGKRLKLAINFFILSRFFAKTVAVSHDVKRHLVSRYGFKRDCLDVIHNGAFFPEGVASGEGASRSFFIGSSGRLFPVKDYPLMVEIARIVVEQEKEARFALAGEGPCRNEIEACVRARGLEGRFLMPGHLDEMAPFYHGLDLYLNTSRHEGIPMTILEALGQGLPVVAPDVGGIPEIIDDGVEGFLVEGRDPHDFAAKCLQILRDRNLHESMSRAARDRATCAFSAEKMAADYHKLYCDLMAQGRNK